MNSGFWNSAPVKILAVLEWLNTHEESYQPPADKSSRFGGILGCQSIDSLANCLFKHGNSYFREYFPSQQGKRRGAFKINECYICDVLHQCEELKANYHVCMFFFVVVVFFWQRKTPIHWNYAMRERKSWNHRMQIKRKKSFQQIVFNMNIYLKIHSFDTEIVVYYMYYQTISTSAMLSLINHSFKKVQDSVFFVCFLVFSIIELVQRKDTRKQ